MIPLPEVKAETVQYSDTQQHRALLFFHTCTEAFSFATAQR